MTKCEILPIAALCVNPDNIKRVGAAAAEKDSLQDSPECGTPRRSTSALKQLVKIAPGIAQHANLIFYISGHLRPEMYFFKKSGLLTFKLVEGWIVSGNYKDWKDYFRLRPLSEVTQQLLQVIKNYENHDGRLQDR